MEAFSLHFPFVPQFSALQKYFRHTFCEWLALLWKCHHFAFSLCYLKILSIQIQGCYLNIQIQGCYLNIQIQGCYLNMSAHLAGLPTTQVMQTWRTKRPLNKPISQHTWKCPTNVMLTDRTEPIMGAKGIICMVVCLCTAAVFILNNPLKLPRDYLNVVARSPC